MDENTVILSNDIKKKIISKMLSYYSLYGNSEMMGLTESEYIRDANKRIYDLYLFIFDSCINSDKNYIAPLSAINVVDIYYLSKNDINNTHSGWDIKMYEGVKYIDFLDLYTILTHGDSIDFADNEIKSYYTDLIKSGNFFDGLGFVVNDYYLNRIVKRKKSLFPLATKSILNTLDSNIY